MQSKIETQIIGLMKKQDKTFVSLLYDHYADSLYGIVLKMVKEEALAKDVMQDSFLKIWKSAAQYDSSKARLFTWLLTICRNTAIDKLRVVKKQMNREIQMDDSFVHTVGTAPFQPQLIDLKDHLAGLAENQQVVIQALFFQGMTQQEASEALDIPLGTVKSRLKIAMRELRAVFGKDVFTILMTLNLWL